MKGTGLASNFGQDLMRALGNTYSINAPLTKVMKNPNVKYQPQKVLKIVCPRCKELMIKIYPYSSLKLTEGIDIPLCMNCQNKGLKLPF